MRLRILRAADEIGGNCVEVEAQGKSLLIDLGLPLAAPKPMPEFLPNVPGLADGGNPNLLGILISHPHQDHYGLLACVHAAVSVFIGDAAHRLLQAAAAFTPVAGIRQPVQTYASDKPFQVGPFQITPLLVDHSAYDAHAFLIEADGQRLLYSGDFRAHGRKVGLMERLLREPPQAVDVLLMEGTTLGRETDEPPQSECELEQAIINSLRETTGLALACFSAQNVDRLVSFYRAALRTDRSLIIDVYTACLLDAINLASLPSPRTGRLRVFLPAAQKRRIKQGQAFDRVQPYAKRRIYSDEIKSNPGRWVMLFRSSMQRDLDALGELAGGKLIYSLWPGYLERDAFDLRTWALSKGMSFEIRHSSGHAHYADLKRFVQAIQPRWLVPMHTLHPHRYQELYPAVRALPNQQWMDLASA